MSTVIRVLVDLSVLVFFAWSIWRGFDSDPAIAEANQLQAIAAAATLFVLGLGQNVAILRNDLLQSLTALRLELRGGGPSKAEKMGKGFKPDPTAN